MGGSTYEAERTTVGAPELDRKNKIKYPNNTLIWRLPDAIGPSGYMTTEELIAQHSEEFRKAVAAIESAGDLKLSEINFRNHSEVSRLAEKVADYLKEVDKDSSGSKRQKSLMQRLFRR